VSGGDGSTIVLLHGAMASPRIWQPLLPTLTPGHGVLVPTLAGHLGVPPMPTGPGNLMDRIVDDMCGQLDEADIGSAHLVGNSLGGWTALELAAIRPAASVTALSPAGFWRKDTPLYCRVSLRASWWLARRLGRPLARLVSWRLGRILVLGQTHGRPGRLSPDDARRAIRDMATAQGFEPALRATARRRYVSHAPIDCPVTVAFGSRDWLLRPRQSRHLEELPARTRVEALPRCGHVPMADDPAAVVALIRSGARRRVSARPPTPDAAVRLGR
jgi:pimeloyl-ACP methyl ester carboxylesterase